MTKIVHKLPEAPRLPSSPYSPGATPDDPVRLAGITVRAVDKIGEAAAKEIDDTADAFETQAKTISDKLRELANAMREHTVVANTHVAEFGEKANSVVDLIRDLEVKLGGGTIAQAAAAIDDGAKIPEFLQQGPAAGNGAAVG
ncbi:MAG: hypothetical protein JWP25_9002 [Bradyrhizobium sp.]|nr:hypothetical protein [Bradyrhizobium sp.]